MQNARRPLVSRALGACALAATLWVAAAAPASATVLTALQLNVYRDGGPTDWLAGNQRLLGDTFDNGNPYIGPNFNVSGGQAAEYNLQGLAVPAHAGLAVSEQGGALLLDPAYGAISPNAQGQLGRSLRLRLLTSVDDLGNPNGGLPRSRSFAAALRLSLAAMPDLGQSFGFRFTDNYSDNSDVIELFVVGGASVDEIIFRKQDFAHGTVTPRVSAALRAPAGADSLVLVLSHSNAHTDDIFGSYGYADLNGALIGSLTTFSIGTTAFQGELHTRIELRATAPVPEPAAWAMMVGGLGLLGVRRLRRR